jgi:DNA modification methylase
MPFAAYQVINLGLQRKNNEIVQYWDDYIEKAKECGYKFLSWNVWSRLQNGTGSIGNASAMFPIVHEWIFVFGDEKKELNPTIPNENAGNVSKKTNRQKDGTLKERTHVTRSFSELRSVIECKTAEVESKEVKHPAMFPVALPAEYIKAMTNEGDIVADSFGGSGTLMVASHQLNHNAYLMELDPKYCSVILKRMKKLDNTLEIKCLNRKFDIEKELSL